MGWGCFVGRACGFRRDSERRMSLDTAPSGIRSWMLEVPGLSNKHYLIVSALLGAAQKYVLCCSDTARLNQGYAVT